MLEGIGLFLKIICFINYFSFSFIANDIMQNLNPFTLIVTIPIMDRIFYPLLRRYGFQMRPMVRITWGFFFAASAMAVSKHISFPQYTKIIDLYID